MSAREVIRSDKRTLGGLVRESTGPLLVPFFRMLPLEGRSPVRLYEAFRGRRGFLLESVEGPERQARYSFVGLEPRLTVEVHEDGIAVAGEPELVALADGVEGETVTERLRALLARFRVAEVPAPRFAVGFVGSFAYEFATALHRRSPVGPRRVPDGPLARLHLTGDLLVVDHAEGTCALVTAPLVPPGAEPGAVPAEADARLDRLLAVFEAVGQGEPAPPQEGAGLVPGFTTLDRAAFEAAVSRALDHVHAGDCLQVVVSRRLDLPFSGDPLSVYRALRSRNPGPYLYLFEEEDRAIVGASPEMLLRVEGRRVTTVPIAGTRPRGRDAAEDARLEAELRADEKERAEHLMLVDLARSDLGRVCETGTVEVEEFMAVERFSHVQHLVSTVTGILRADRDRLDALGAAFPAGTVSGAPRLRAMELVESLEPTARGVYAGAVGYLDLRGSMDLAIAIRTAVVRGGTASVQVGAGIVADSVPEHEFAETEAKARGILVALAAGAGGAA